MVKIRSRIAALFLAFTMVFGLISIPVNAEEIATNYDAAAFLKEKSLLRGDDQGNLMLDKQLTREQMMVIISRLLGIEEDAKSYPLDDLTFKDVPTWSEYAHYIAWAQAEDITQGYDSKTFGFGKPLTAWQTRAFLVRVLGYKDTEDADMDAKAEELGIINDGIDDFKAPILRVDMALLMYNTLKAENSDGEVLGNTLGVLEDDGQEQQNNEITASVVNNKTIKVTFNIAVEDTAAYTFVLKGASVVETKVTWNEDKTEAALETANVLAEGTYTVTVAGDGFDDTNSTAEVNIEKSGIAKIEFINDKLVKDAAHDSNYKATFRIKVSDNFGTDITNTLTDSDLVVTATKTLNSNNPYDLDGQSGVVTLNFANKLAVDDKIVAVTVLDKEAKATANQVLTVSESGRISTIALKEITYPTGVTKVLTGKNPAAYITVEAKDQYGNLITSKSAADADLMLVKADTALGLSFEEYTDNAGNKGLRIVINTTGIAAAKTIKVTAVSKVALANTGNVSSIDVAIKEPSKADKVTVGTPDKVFAAKDPAGTFALPLTVKDQYGIELTPDEIITNVDSGNLIINANAGFAIEVARTGDNKGKIVNKDANAVQGAGIITISTKTGAYATYIAMVKEQAYPKLIQVVGSPAANMLTGAKTALSYKFIDQYDREMKAPGNFDVTVEISDAKIIKATLGETSTSETNKVLVTKASAVSTENAIQISTVTDEGTGKLTAKLYKDGQVVNSSELSIRILKSIPSDVTFEIADIPVLPSRTADGAIDGTDKYARPIVLTAKDSSGSVYAIPSDRIIAVTTTDTGMIAISQAAVTTSGVKAQEGNFVVAAKSKVSAFPNTGDPVTKTATIKVLVATNDGPKEVAKTITVSKEDPKAVKVVFSDKDLKSGNPYAPDPTAKEVSALTGTVDEIGNAKLYIFEVDQYGVYTKVTPSSLRAINIDKFSGTLSYDANDNTLNFASTQIKANETVYVMYLTTNGMYNTFTIKASNGTM